MPRAISDVEGVGGKEGTMFGRSKLFIMLFVMTTVVPYVVSTSSGFTTLVARYWPAKSGDKAPVDAASVEAGQPLAPLASTDPATPKPAPARRRRFFRWKKCCGST